MFTIPNALKNICRHMRKSVLYVLICVIAVLTMQIYMAGIDRTEKQLELLPDAIPISATVASLDGSRFTGLQILEMTVDGLQSSQYVRDLLMSYFLGGWVGETVEDYTKNQTGFIVGVNTAAVLDEFSPDNVEWLPDYSPDFLAGDEAACIVNQTLAASHGWVLGDMVSINSYCYQYGSMGTVYYEQLGPEELRIVGIADLSAVTANTISPNIIIPFEYGRVSFQRQNIDFHASSASFYLRDASKLNDFKAEMKSIRLTQAQPSGDVAMMVAANQGTALLVNDATFISSATRLQETLSLLRGFLPLLAAVLVVIGYLVAYLMIQTRREEYAVLRLLGLGKRKSMSLYLTEMAALTLGGSFVGMLISAALGIGGFSSGVIVFILFSFCFMIGSVIALMRLGRTNVMLALTQAE